MGFVKFVTAAAVIVSPALIVLAKYMQAIRNSIDIPGIINPLIEALERQRLIDETAMNSRDIIEQEHDDDESDDNE